MKTIIIQRDFINDSDSSIIGYLTIRDGDKITPFLYGGELVYTLELPYKDNIKNESSIPMGSYTAYYRTDKNRYQFDDVPNRSGIQIHNGNSLKSADVQGCILIGTTLKGTIDGKAYLESSPVAILKALRALVGDKCNITVTLARNNLNLKKINLYSGLIDGIPIMEWNKRFRNAIMSAYDNVKDVLSNGYPLLVLGAVVYLLMKDK